MPRRTSLPELPSAEDVLEVDAFPVLRRLCGFCHRRGSCRLWPPTTWEGQRWHLRWRRGLGNAQGGAWCRAKSPLVSPSSKSTSPHRQPSESGSKGSRPTGSTGKRWRATPEAQESRIHGHDDFGMSRTSFQVQWVKVFSVESSVLLFEFDCDGESCRAPVSRGLSTKISLAGSWLRSRPM